MYFNEFYSSRGRFDKTSEPSAFQTECKSNTIIYKLSALLGLKIRKGLRFATACYIANTLKPPSTTAIVPVTNLAASLIR